MLETVQGDTDAGVRAAAVDSLGYFKNLSAETRAGLFKALRDEPAVGLKAAEILGRELNRPPADSAGCKDLRRAMRKALDNKMLAPATRQTLADLLADQGDGVSHQR